MPCAKAQRARAHLQIGRRLQTVFDREGGSYQKQIELVRHKNLGAEALETEAERKDLARLNLGAAKAAKANGAYRLQATLVEAEIEKRAAATAADRKLQVGSGDRSQRIRTYNYPQGRITDHRVEGLTLYDLPNILEGELDPLVGRLQQERQAEELARLAQEA